MKLCEKNNILKVSFVTDSFYKNNCFLKHGSCNRDNYLEHIHKLKAELIKVGIDLSTSDINTPTDSSAIIQYGTNVGILTNIGKKHYYLIALESPVVDPGATTLKYHDNFDKIFTWNDDLIDNKKYFKVNDAHKFPSKIPKKFDNKKLCCLIAGNKFANNPCYDELYSKRVDFIRWFEKNHIEEFSLYGTGWDEYRFGKSILGRALNKIKIFRKKDIFPSYKGRVESKYETMIGYKFSICYENVKGQKGYITEKIFDSFFAGCVPIYLGAENISHHIPKGCFIDQREFNSYNEVYCFMKDMSKETYMRYLNNIEVFLSSSKASQFRDEVFAKTIASEVAKDLGRAKNDCQ